MFIELVRKLLYNDSFYFISGGMPNTYYYTQFMYINRNVISISIIMPMYRKKVLK